MGTLERRMWSPDLEPGLRRRDRRPCHYECYLPDLLVGRDLRLRGETVADVSDAERAVVALNADAPRTDRLESLARLLLRAEAVASSRIEGLEISPGRLARIEAARASGVQVSDVTAEAVLGNVRALEVAVQDVAGREVVRVHDLLAIHAALLGGGSRHDLAGRIRESQNWIGGSDYNPCSAAFVPPPPDQVPGLLDDLCAYVNADQDSPLVQAAVAHAQFETIHPFADGNGRTGRALIHVVLRRRGLTTSYVPPVSLVLATRSRDYVRGLTAFRFVGAPHDPAAMDGVEEWIGVFTAACHRATADARRFAKDLDRLEADWRHCLGGPRRGSAVDLLVSAAPQAPVLTVASAARLIGRSVQATNLAVGRLVHAGILRQVTVGRRNRAFEVVGVLKALTALERRLATPRGDTRIDPPVRPVPYRPAATDSS